jgi:hypothetical protein
MRGEEEWDRFIFGAWEILWRHQHIISFLLKEQEKMKL